MPGAMTAWSSTELIMACWQSMSRSSHWPHNRSPVPTRSTTELVVGGCGDVAAGLGDAVGDGVAGRDPFPRRYRSLGIEKGHQFIQAGLVGFQLRGQRRDIGIDSGFTGQGVGQLRGVQPGQHRVGQQFFDRLCDHGEPSAATVVTPFQTPVATDPVGRIVMAGLGKQPLPQRPQRSIPDSRVCQDREAGGATPVSLSQIVNARIDAPAR